MLIVVEFQQYFSGTADAPLVVDACPESVPQCVSMLYNFNFLLVPHYIEIIQFLFFWLKSLLDFVFEYLKRHDITLHS